MKTKDKKPFLAFSGNKDTTYSGPTPSYHQTKIKKWTISSKWVKSLVFATDRLSNWRLAWIIFWLGFVQVVCNEKAVFFLSLALLSRLLNRSLSLFIPKLGLYSILMHLSLFSITRYECKLLPYFTTDFQDHNSALWEAVKLQHTSKASMRNDQ